MTFSWLFEVAHQKARKVVDTFWVYLNKIHVYGDNYCIFSPHSNLAINHFGNFVLVKTNWHQFCMCLSSYWWSLRQFKIYAQSFYKHRILEGLMIQQWEPTLNKKIHCYIAILFPLELPDRQIHNNADSQTIVKMA